VNKIYSKTLTKNELLKENQKLRELLKKTIPDLPHVPDSESIGKIRKYYNEVQSLNAQLKSITQEMLAIRAKHGEEILSIIKKQEINTELKVQEEKEKAIKEISNLKNEIFQLKEIINREKMDAEMCIQLLLESGANQVSRLQEEHDLSEAFQRGRISMEPLINKLEKEIEDLKELNRKCEIDSMESIQVVIESGAAQVFGLQEALAKSEATVEAVTRLARGLLRPR
jgi:type II secretory pathway component HofQ